jgi:hypothetical protein
MKMSAQAESQATDRREWVSWPYAVNKQQPRVLIQATTAGSSESQSVPNGSVTLPCLPTDGPREQSNRRVNSPLTSVSQACLHLLPHFPCFPNACAKTQEGTRCEVYLLTERYSTKPHRQCDAVGGTNTFPCRLRGS